MLLTEEENSLTGVLVGLVNGLYGEIKDIEQEIRKAVSALKNKDISLMIEMEESLRGIKGKSFPNCKTCVSPCGRTTDYLINSLDDSIRDEKIKELYSFLDNYNDNMAADVVSYNISRLSW